MKELVEMDEYTPTTAVVRATYLNRKVQTGAPIEVRGHAADFDRWLAAHDAEVAARALRDAAEEWASDPEPVGDTSADYRNWLRDRADQVESAS